MSKKVSNVTEVVTESEIRNVGLLEVYKIMC